MQLPFARTKGMQTQVDAFFDVVVKGVLAFQEGIHCYMKCDPGEFDVHIEMVSDCESEADDVSRALETALYTYSLIPESRGDVLSLLEHTDNIIDLAKEVLQRFQVEQPDIPADFQPGYLELTAKSVQAVDHVVRAARMYFRDPNQVRDETNKVDFYESEADRAGLALKNAIFRSGLRLSHKQHLRYFAESIESMSDLAEDLASRLSIATIKRSV